MPEKDVRATWKKMAFRQEHGRIRSPEEVFEFYPDVLPDNRARGFVNDEGRWISNDEKGGKDMFGVEWVYVPSAGGSMEKPGIPFLLEDVNDWHRVIQWPNVDNWDWEKSAERNRLLLNSDRVKYIPLLNGFGFERLVSFLGFENAAVALIDDDQVDAVRELLDQLAELACRIVDLCCTHYDVDGFLVHDDWGGQRDPFFSQAVGRELFVPPMQKITSRIHAHGKVAELHSCGCLEKQIVNFIEGGWDIWHPMTDINNTMALFEKYGDQIVLGVSPEGWNRRETQENAAYSFAEAIYSLPRRSCVLNRYFVSKMPDEYKKALDDTWEGMNTDD